MVAPTYLPPLNAVGYAVNGFWQAMEYEETPELRWPLSVQVYDRMGRQDSQVASVIRAVTLPIRRTPWRLDQNGARDEVTEHVAKDLGLQIKGADDPEVVPRTRGRFSWREHLRHACLMLRYGHAYFEQLYRDYDGATHLAKLEWRPPRTIDEIKVAMDGGLVGIHQFGMGSTQLIGVDRLVAYVNEREGGNWAGQSLLRPAYKHWLVKDRLIRVGAQAIERNGMGVPVYKSYPDEGEKDPGFTKGLKIAQDLRAGATAGAAIDHDAELDLLGIKGNLADPMPQIRYHDEQIARAVLAHFLNLGTQTGSWALGTTFADFFTQSLQAVADEIADVATGHIVEDIVDKNWGEDEQAPRIVFDEIGSRQIVTAQALQALISAGAIVMDPKLEAALRETYGLPPKDPDAPDAAPPIPAPPPDTESLDPEEDTNG